MTKKSIVSTGTMPVIRAAILINISIIEKKKIIGSIDRETMEPHFSHTSLLNWRGSFFKLKIYFC